MTRTAAGNTREWFASDEDRALAWRWASSSGIATLLVWWFEGQAFLLLALMFLYQLFLAVRSYSITGRRLFLWFTAAPVGLLIMPWVGPPDSRLQAILFGAVAVVATVFWPLVGLLGVATLVAPGRLSARGWTIRTAAALLGVAGYADSVTAFTTWSDPTPDPSALAGCYRVHRGFSFPLTERPLPAVIQLDTTRWSAADTVEVDRTAIYLAGDRRVTPSVPPFIGHWKIPEGGPVVVGWSYRRLGGMRGRFRRDGDDLIGRLVQYQDMSRIVPLPVLSVRFKRTVCSTPRS